MCTKKLLELLLQVFTDCIAWSPTPTHLLRGLQQYIDYCLSFLEKAEKHKKKVFKTAPKYSISRYILWLKM